MTLSMFLWGVTIYFIVKIVVYRKFIPYIIQIAFEVMYDSKGFKEMKEENENKLVEKIIKAIKEKEK